MAWTWLPGKITTILRWCSVSKNVLVKQYHTHTHTQTRLKTLLVFIENKKKISKFKNLKIFPQVKHRYLKQNKQPLQRIFEQV